jgi:cytochrome c553
MTYESETGTKHGRTTRNDHAAHFAMCATCHDEVENQRRNADAWSAYALAKLRQAGPRQTGFMARVARLLGLR